MLIREIISDFTLTPSGSLPLPSIVSSPPRAPGYHVSELLRINARDMGVLKVEDQDELDWTLAKYQLARGETPSLQYPEAIYRVALGLSWESWLGAQWPQINFHLLGELTRDRITGTPDGLSFCPPADLPYYTLFMQSGKAYARDEPTGLFFPYDPTAGQAILHEIKLTWKSSRASTEEPHVRLAREWLWYAQMKSYCWMASTRATGLVTTAHLHVYWVNGRYKGGGPEFRSYEFIFTEKELRANWQLLTSNVARLDAQKELDAKLQVLQMPGV